LSLPLIVAIQIWSFHAPHSRTFVFFLGDMCVPLPSFSNPSPPLRFLATDDISGNLFVLLGYARVGFLPSDPFPLLRHIGPTSFLFPSPARSVKARIYPDHPSPIYCVQSGLRELFFPPAAPFFSSFLFPLPANDFVRNNLDRDLNRCPVNSPPFPPKSRCLFLPRSISSA